MAQRVAAAMLRWALSSWAEEAELDAQLLKGEVRATRARLRPFDVTPRLRCTGAVEKLAASWSWRGLISSPVLLVEDLTLLIEFGEVKTVCPQHVQPAESAEPPPSLLQRLGRRLREALSVEILRLHVRVEVSDTMMAEFGAIGFVVGRLRIAAEGDAGMTITDAGIYVETTPAMESEMWTEEPPPLAKAPPADEAAFITNRMSPSCRVVRHSGRRFVDSRGLEVHIDLDSPRVRCTQEQFLLLLRMHRRLSAGAEENGAEESGDDGWHDVLRDTSQDVSPPSPRVARPRSQSAPVELLYGDKWKRTKESGAADWVLLLAEDALPPEAAAFQLSVEVRGASIDMAGGLLAVSFSGGGRFLSRVDEWEAECGLASLIVIERTGASGEESAQICSGVGSGPLVTIEVCCATTLVASVEVSPFEVRITQGAFGALHQLYSNLQAEDNARNDELVGQQTRCSCTHEPPTSEWSLTWKMTSFSVSIDCLAAIRLVFNTTAVGMESRGARAVSTADATMSVELEDKHGRRRLLEETLLYIGRREDGKVEASCEAVVANCCLHEVVAVTHGMRAFGATLAGAQNSGSRLHTQWWANAEVRVEHLELRIADKSTDSQCVATAVESRLFFEGGRCVVTATSCNARLRVDGVDRGLLRLCGPSVLAVGSAGGGRECSGRCGVEVFDLQEQNGRVAIGCPAMRAEATWECGSEAHAIILRLEVHAGVVVLDADEAFIASCHRGALRLGEVVRSLLVDVVVFQDLPLGLLFEDTTVVSVSGPGTLLSIVPGSIVLGVVPAPAAEVDLASALKVCQVPVTLIMQRRPPFLLADVTLAPFTLQASRFTARRAVEVAVVEAQIDFAGFELQAWRGTCRQLGDRVAQFYYRELMRELPWLMTAVSISGRELSQVAAVAIGSSLASLRAGGSSLVKGVAAASFTAVKSLERKGAGEGSYRVGDVARGILALSQESLPAPLQ